MSKDTQGNEVTIVPIDPAVLEALKRLLEAIEKSQATIIDDAANSASQISDNFDQQLRLNPALLHEQITL